MSFGIDEKDSYVNNLQAFIFKMTDVCLQSWLSEDYNTVKILDNCTIEFGFNYTNNLWLMWGTYAHTCEHKYSHRNHNEKTPGVRHVGIFNHTFRLSRFPDGEVTEIKMLLQRECFWFHHLGTLMLSGLNAAFTLSCLIQYMWFVCRLSN